MDKLPLEAASIVPAGADRTIFALPWYGRALIGTTDNDYDGDIGHVQPAQDDIEYLLAAVNEFFATDLGESDLTGAYAGVRPLISTGDPRKSVDISRKAELYETSSGMLTITGGKLTTWRRMAKQVVDRMVEREGRVAPCRTDDIPLGMAAGEGELDPPDGLDESDLPEGYRELLGFRYGHAAGRCCDCASSGRSWPPPSSHGQPDLLAEVVVAARREQARTVADVLLRRTRLGLLAAPQLRTAESVAAVAEALGNELGWDSEGIAAEAERWVADARSEGIDPAAVGVSEPGYRVVDLDSLERVPLEEGVWRPVRRRLGVTAFGVNAYTANAPGDALIEGHDETSPGAGGHEELYLVVRGRATFESGRGVDRGRRGDDDPDRARGTAQGDRRQPGGDGDGHRRQARERDAAVAVRVLVRGDPAPMRRATTAARTRSRPRGSSTIPITARSTTPSPASWRCSVSASGRSRTCGPRSTNDPRTREWAREDSDLDSLRDDPLLAG